MLRSSSPILKSRSPHRFPHRLAVFTLLVLAAAPNDIHGAQAGGCLAVGHDICVIDGDTITFHSERIRIANIDAPEIGHPQCDAERRLGLVARKRLAALLGSGQVDIKRVDPKSGRMTDRYSRTLGTVYIDGKDGGETLISEELARPWRGKREPWCN